MANEELKLAGAALLLGRFTSKQLSDFAGVNPHTARAWVQRNGEFWDAVPVEADARQRGRGRPAMTFRVLPKASRLLQRQLDRLEQSLDVMEPALKNEIDGVEAQHKAWLSASQNGDPIADKEFAGLRTQIRLAWEDCAAFFDARQSPPMELLRRLAEIERHAGISSLPDSEDLFETARWLAGRLKDMNARAVPDRFSGRVWRIRASVRSATEQARLTAAAVGAPVWGDEGLADGEMLTEADVWRCRVVSDETEINARLDDLGRAMDRGPFALCKTDFERQALARGLTALSNLPTREILGWLAKLQFSSFWSPHLAPVAFHGLIEGPDIRFQSLLSRLADDLSTALNHKPLVIGRLRREALDYSANALSAPPPALGQIGAAAIDRLRHGSASLSFNPTKPSSPSRP